MSLSCLRWLPLIMLGHSIGGGKSSGRCRGCCRGLLLRHLLRCLRLWRIIRRGRLLNRFRLLRRCRWRRRHLGLLRDVRYGHGFELLGFRLLHLRLHVLRSHHHAILLHHTIAHWCRHRWLHWLHLRGHHYHLAIGSLKHHSLAPLRLQLLHLLLWHRVTVGHHHAWLLLLLLHHVIGSHHSTHSHNRILWQLPLRCPRPYLLRSSRICAHGIAPIPFVLRLHLP
mmetsp:Transcript_44772/g.136625  ORF Transcript_44772/g.136625 Transcript_44772/m.136625 type:complete len:225 (+) Transcript_44772:1924-2598(+)